MFLKNEDGPVFTHADTGKLLTTDIHIEKDKLLRKEDGKGSLCSICRRIARARKILTTVAQWA